MSIATKRHTYQDLLQTPDDGKRYEVIDGELYVIAAPAKPHFWLSSSWLLWLGEHVRARDLGKIFHAPVDVHFDDDNTVEPDLIFVRKDRLHIVKHNYIDEAPDLLIEIHSPSTKHVDLGKKLRLYQAFEVQEYWAVDTDEQSLTIFVLSAAGSYERVEPVNGHLSSTVLPELVIDLAAIFSDLPGEETA
ncbi:MAG: hypothetical protein QOJ59_3638 [Thermomicrobiales bacterium]|jgi:Uma2 family endonuclease|nr:hypothetical protein [Thermomicrobiales bacterium]